MVTRSVNLSQGYTQFTIEAPLAKKAAGIHVTDVPSLEKDSIGLSLDPATPRIEYAELFLSMRCRMSAALTIL